MRRVIVLISFLPLLFQSTHPLRDATLACYRYCLHMVYFNPRTPYGMRPHLLLIILQIYLFQSTHPLRDATMRVYNYGCNHRISIHAPLTGCDIFSYKCCLSTAYFNPRTPYGMRLRMPLRDDKLYYISIHAPLTGCDSSWQKVNCSYDEISIHAPLTGCDVLPAPYFHQHLIFQSTHPLRDAT